MTRTESAKLLICAACGAAGALAFAIGLPLMVMWIFDTASRSAGLPELIGGVASVAIGVLCISARRWLISARTVPPRDGERAT